VVEMAKNLKPSARGELEITDINRIYLEQGAVCGNDGAWVRVAGYWYTSKFDQASNFIATIEERQGLKVSCPEEIAYRKGLLTLHS
jgi:glucose-1-phosphate thymidylyltransferase